MSYRYRRIVRRYKAHHAAVANRRLGLSFDEVVRALMRGRA